MVFKIQQVSFFHHSEEESVEEEQQQQQQKKENKNSADRGARERDSKDNISIVLCLPTGGKRTGFLDTCPCCLVLSALAVSFFVWPLAVCSRSSPELV